MNTKFKQSFLVFAALTMFIFIACEETKDKVEEKIIGKMSAKIDGEDWEADAPLGKTNNEKITITGIGLIGGNKKAVILKLDGSSSATYSISYNPMDTGEVSFNAATLNQDYDNVTASNTYLGYSGQIEITETSSERITGNFNFKCANYNAGSGVDTIEVNNGIFKNINYK